MHGNFYHGKCGKEGDFMTETTRYTLLKLPMQELISQKFDVTMDRDTAAQKEYLIAQDSSLLFDQIERLRGTETSHISEVILVAARKDPRQEKDLRHLLREGFRCNNVHYRRFGKSASQGKAGITAFVCDHMFEELYRITQMDIPVKECVISKYEAQRCLSFSSCSLIRGYMPNIVIIGEYEKVLRNQFIKYVVSQEKEFTDPQTGEKKTCTVRKIREGYRDLKLSFFDGCGCHEHGFTEQVSAQLGLDYLAIGMQVRLPFIKGYSVYVPFRAILREWGYESITDIYGVSHPIDTIDCIWNISMFKGHRLFLETYGNDAWTQYMKTLRKYSFKLGISKYSHHIKDIHRYSRMNFQYLQCLDLWNPKYMDSFKSAESAPYDILDPANDGKTVRLARYTTSLFEKIIRGDKFYTLKFMGIADTKTYEPESKYLEAVLINDAMLKDPAVKQFLYRKLKKSIDEAKVGKIYCSGFYHTGVGDMIGYLQYAVGQEPVGCLKERELYSGNFDCKEIASFRSPLMDPSEVNRIRIARNALLDKWFGYFKDQDIVMFNMYDISAPQQGGADFDGDIFFLCDDPVIIDAKIDKPVILDIEDKITAKTSPYTEEAIVEYEVMTRDSRIGEITNAATSIENRYTTDPKIRELYSDYASLLRIFQGKEIDFLKTGFRWHMGSGLKKHIKQIPFFLLFNYPDKLKKYKELQEKNKKIEKKEDKLKLNAYRSPSPMNELCDYICAWEKKHILWERDPEDLTVARNLLLKPGLDLSDRETMRTVRRFINEYADEIRRHIALCREKSKAANHKFHVDELAERFRKKLKEDLRLEEEIIANYVIKVSYNSFFISKSLAWTGYGDYIIQNLKQNSDPGKHISIREVPRRTDTSYEYLGKYYAFKEVRDRR